MIEKLQKIQKELDEIYNYFNNKNNTANYSELIAFNYIYNIVKSIEKIINE